MGRTDPTGDGSQRRSRQCLDQGWVGAAGDNVALESFYSLLQKNVRNRRRR
jgi:hypothetical protein